MADSPSPPLPPVPEAPSPPTNGHNGDASFWAGLVESVRRPVRRLLGTREFPGEADARRQVAASEPKRKVRVLFVDVGNSSRSQVAQAFATIYGFHAESAGTFPAMHVAPEAVAAMAEIGIDISGFRPKPLDTSRLDAFDRVVTFGDPLPTPYRGRPRVEDWNVIDPQGLSVSGYVTMRNDVESRVKALARRFKVRQPDLVALQG